MPKKSNSGNFTHNPSAMTLVRLTTKKTRKVSPRSVIGFFLVSVLVFEALMVNRRVIAIPIGEQDFGLSKVVINFDTLTNGTEVNTQFQNLGVLFFNEFGGSVVAVANGNARSQPIHICGVRGSSHSTDINLRFTTPVTSLGADIFDGDRVGGVVFLTVFGPNAEIESVSTEGAVHQFIALRPAFPIVRARFTGILDCVDDLTFERAVFTLNVQKLSQGPNTPWSNNLYDHSTTKTIRQKGCALTSLSMALNFAGIQNDPGSLNDFMIRTDNDYVRGGNVNWGPTTRDRSGGTLTFNSFRSKATKALDDALSQGFPVIVGVNLKNGVPGHFVLVTGKQGNQYTIADPGHANRTTLNSYNNQFETRGYVRRARAANVHSSDNAAEFATPTALEGANLSELDIATGDTAQLLVVNAAGQRAGFDVTTGTILEEIGGSSYFRDSLDDDETGAPATEEGRLLQITEPVGGTYRLDVIGVKLGLDTLSIRAFSEDGSAQPPILIQDITGVGSTSSFQIQLALDAGAVPTVIRTATVESTLNDIRNSLDLGLVDNAGVAKALSNKLLSAQAALARGNPQTSKQILEGFKTLVRAQESKHIDPFAAKLLLDDADFLLGQMAR